MAANTFIGGVADHVHRAEVLRQGVGVGALRDGDVIKATEPSDSNL